MPDKTRNAVKAALITDQKTILDRMHEDAKQLLSIAEYLAATEEKQGAANGH